MQGDGWLRFIRRQNEYEDVATFVFERTTPLEFEAGQYAFVSVGGQRDRAMVRELSFASAPLDSEVWFTVHIRRGSSFKQALAALPPGGLVQAYDIQGRMVAPEELTQPLVMVAQGIGVTPVRSLLRQHAGLRARVVHVARGEHLFAEELAARSQHYQPVGRDDLPDLYKEIARDWDGAPVYLSGAPEFVARAARQLGMLGIPYPALRSTMFDAYSDLD